MSARKAVDDVLDNLGVEESNAIRASVASLGRQDGTPVEPPTSVVDADVCTALNTAAELLVGQMPLMTQSVLRETAISLHAHLWMLVVGLLQRCYDNGEHTAPAMDPVWTYAMPSALGELGEATCGVCAQTFRPRWPGQEYCSNDCGTVATNRRRSVVGGADVWVGRAVGAELPDEARSTIFEAESHGTGRGDVEAAQHPAVDPGAGHARA